MTNARTTYTEKLKMLTVAAMFTALAYIVTVVFHIKVVFLTFEFKDAVMTIGAMICGPVYAIAMSLVTALVECFTISDTGAYGLIMNILASAAFTLPAALIYKYKRTFQGAVVGIGTSILSMTAVMMLANLIITPYYMMNSTVSDVATMIPTLLLPFNLTKATLNAGMVLLLYKPIVQTLRKAKLVPSPQNTDTAHDKKRTVLMLLLALLLIAVSAAVFLLVLKGNISIGLTNNAKNGIMVKNF